MLAIRVLESERLQTRSLLFKDAERLFSIYSDKEAMKFRGSQPMSSIADAYEMIAGQHLEEGNTTKLRCALIVKSEQLLVGTLLFKVDNELPSKCEIGFSFDKDHWNKGYGSEAIRMVIAEFKENQTMHELQAWCIKENRASMSILEKNGFSIQQQNKYPQSHLYALDVKV